MSNKEETHSNLTFLDTKGRPYNPDEILLSNDEFEEGVDVITSDDRYAKIVGVGRTVAGCAGTNNSVSVRYSVTIEPQSKVLPNLYEDIKLARAFVDNWVIQYTKKGKQPPKRRLELAEFMVSDMALSEECYIDTLDEGVEEYLKRNLKP
ncbi:hypothetical protein [Vibrio alginolyticus]|uniref:hypothetical protein n=1 Tax=Vibrio TaxID=662 RepID=UPI0006CA74C6|nr:hypothetical protein [Vibrio alginolyticus]KPM98372.1 hypothetical protein AOG25_07955 [Vibrio alginolyticus]CAH7129958.1 conserved hypothetical protein [Vibrio chagasii]CAH7221387.1 conserved hypothetical protein [Vibrio chagasii]